MNSFAMILENKVLIIAGLGWVTAGILKVIIELIINKKLSVSRLLGSGGMPSSHTSTVVSLVIAVGYDCGLNTVQFAIVVIFAIIVIHDAVGVRQETGKQAQILNQIMFDTSIFDDLDFEKRLKEYIGHTPFQVLVGAIVGVVVSIIAIRFLY